MCLALKNRGAILLVRDLQQGAEIVNELALEHLEIVTKNDNAVLKNIKNAGSIFLGNYTPVVVGDYFAGPNHVLPTERTARFFSPLSVDTFIKKSSVVHYSRRTMESVSEKVARFAEHEGLTAHALSARLRGRKKQTMNFLDKIKPSVRALETYAVKGKTLQPGLIKLNQNENPLDVPDEIKRELTEEFLNKPWNRYPEVFPADCCKPCRHTFVIL